MIKTCNDNKAHGGNGGGKTLQKNLIATTV